MLQPIKFQQLLIALILASISVFFIYRKRTPQFAKNSLVFGLGVLLSYVLFLQLL